MYPAELDKWRRRPIVGQGDGGMERVSRRRSQPSEKLTDEVRQHHRERGKEPEEQNTEKKRLWRIRDEAANKDKRQEGRKTDVHEMSQKGIRERVAYDSRCYKEKGAPWSTERGPVPPRATGQLRLRAWEKMGPTRQPPNNY